MRVCRLGLLANPGEIEGRLVLGSALMALGRFDEVLAEMRQALQIDPQHPGAMALKGEALLRKGDAASARSVLGRAKARAPADARVAQLRREVEGALSSPAGPTNTIDIDPEIEGVEIRDSAVRRRAVDPESLLELDSQDLELVDDDAEESTVTAAVGGDRDEDTTTGHFRDRTEEGPTAHFGGPRAAAPLPPQGYGGPAAASQSGTIGAPPEPAGAPALEALFPEEEPGVSSLEVLDPVSGEPRSVAKQPAPVDPLGRTMRAPPEAFAGARPSDDMATIRAGLGLPDGGRGASASRSARRAGLPMWVYLLTAAVVLGAGVLAGFELRDLRLGRQIAAARAEAERVARTDDYRGAVAARELYDRIADARGSAAHRAELARAEARLSAEFGVRRAEASAAVASLGDADHLDALAARGYLALAEGDAARARSAAEGVLALDPKAGVGHYLLGRAELLAGRADEAAAAFEQALAADPRPLRYVGLARAEAARGRFSEALAALGRATEAGAAHPSAIAWKARVLAASGRLPDDPSAPGDALSVLVASAENGDPSVSAAQGGWAALALGEVRAARGDRQAALEAAGRAESLRPGSDPSFDTALAELYLELGELAKARAEAERAAEAWPQRASVLAARLALADGDVAAAQATLEKAGEGAIATPEGRATRGRVHLALGALDEAGADLDAALTARPSLREAAIARARLDLLRGDARAARERLEPLHAQTPSAPAVAIAYAAALSATGADAEARKTLAPLVEGQGASAAALIELARIERRLGNFGAAAEAFARAIEVEPTSVEARIGAARLALDDGRPEEARELAGALLEDAAGDARVLVEAARIHTATGEAERAIELLDAAAESSSALAWKVARERGRALSRRLDPIQAISELERAVSLEPEDAETRVLLMEAHFQARNKQGARRALQDITKTFRDRPVRSVAAGIHALGTDRGADAATALVEARQQLEAARASKRDRAEAAYWLGRAYELDGKSAEAIAALEAAVKLDPSHADAYFWLGQLHFTDNELGKMVRRYEQSVAADPGANPLAWFFLAQEYHRQKQTAKAVTALEAFLARFPEDSGDVVVEAKALLAKLK